MRKLYTSILLFFLLTMSLSSFGQIVANSNNIFTTCGYYGNNPSDNVLFNDTINGNAFSYTDVTITIINNPYNGIIDLDIDPLSSSYGFLIMYNPTIYGQFTIAYQICEVANPTNCDIGYVSLYNDLIPVTVNNDDFSGTPIDNSTGGTTSSVLLNDYSACFGPPLFGNSIVNANSSLPTGLTLNPDGTISVAVNTIPGVYIISYTVCENMSGTCDSASAFVYVTGVTNIVANYDDFSSPNYPNSMTPSVLNNDTVNGYPVSFNDVNFTPLNVPVGFSFTGNGYILIDSTVPEGTYNIPYQICSNIGLGCYVNYAYVVVLKNRILGKIKFDANNNGCDTGDAYLSNIHAKNINGTTTYTSYSNYYGNQYYLIGDAGTNTVSINLPSYFTVTPANQVFNLSTPGTITAPDFCVTANTNVDDLEVVLIPLFNVVPGLPAIYNVWYKNNGSTTLSGQVSFQFDNSKMTFSSSNPSPNSNVGNQLTYNFTNLGPFESRMISSVKFQVAIPPTVDQGNVVTFSGSISPVVSDLTPLNNNSSVSQTVVNSQDPNDIIVHEGSSISLAQAQQDYLHYTIRFQNIGTSDAINVKVVNDLDTKLDWSTFELISTSHNCRVKNNNGHNEFLFEGINLPGSNNEPLSHGYVTYKIKPISTIAIGNTISNMANIYFDFNAPIVTNVANTTVSALSNQNFTFNDFKFYPNPVKNSLSISNASLIEEIEITSLLGQKILTKKINELQTELNLSELANGVYFVKVRSEGQEKIVKILKD
ncbi:T9SS type A sorting domain-containing protein [Flavobacterium sp.]|uniref:T9SS type A sorting domain-containing protein n=1 Tax=Flavobacterium sp. TaxID=239 RepID=UPI00261F73D9|nr:T9SS type A sorting domain-containing protein [Flavobacterium sp.]